MAAYTFNPSILGSKDKWISVASKSALSICGALGHPGLSQKNWEWGLGPWSGTCLVRKGLRPQC